MPQAVTHILIPILLVALLRDLVVSKKSKKHFPLHYVLLAGVGGALPDIDIPISIVLNFLGADSWNVHKTFSHSLFFPLVLLAIAGIFALAHKDAKICNLTRHKLHLGTIFFMLALGALSHILLDALTYEQAQFFYPISSAEFGFNLIALLPTSLQSLALPTLDGILLFVWLIYLELKHKISDFI